jgi:hypothetical protein
MVDHGAMKQFGDDQLIEELGYVIWHFKHIWL